jgi:hypothetical protein
MDYRRGPRFEVDQPVNVTNLEDRTPFPGKLADFSANGVRLILDRKIPLGSIVKVEWGGTLLLGEVVYCQVQDAEFSVGLELEDAIYDTEALANQMRPRRGSSAAGN